MDAAKQYARPTQDFSLNTQTFQTAVGSPLSKPPSSQEANKDAPRDLVLNDAVALGQRLKQLTRQRSDIDQDIGRMTAQLLDQASRQHEFCQAAAARLEREQARADAAEKTAAELRASLKKQLDMSGGEATRLQDALAHARAQAASAVEQAGAERKAREEMEERCRRLEEELNAWKEQAAFHAPPHPGLQLGMPPYGPPPHIHGESMPPHHHPLGPHMPPGMPHGMPPMPWMHGPMPGPMPPFPWLAPGMVHTPLPPAMHPPPPSGDMIIAPPSGVPTATPGAPSAPPRRPSSSSAHSVTSKPDTPPPAVSAAPQTQPAQPAAQPAAATPGGEQLMHLLGTGGGVPQPAPVRRVGSDSRSFSAASDEGRDTDLMRQERDAQAPTAHPAGGKAGRQNHRRHHGKGGRGSDASGGDVSPNSRAGRADQDAPHAQGGAAQRPAAVDRPDQGQGRAPAGSSRPPYAGQGHPGKPQPYAAAQPGPRAAYQPRQPVRAGGAGSGPANPAAARPHAPPARG